MTKMKKVIIPYVGINRVIEVLKVLYREKTRVKSISEMKTLVGGGFKNVIPTLTLLGLANTEKDLIRLTDDGMSFINSITSGDEEMARKIVQKAINRSQSLKFVKSLLETKVQLTGEEIGQALAEHFNKRWDNIATYRTFGNSCGSILAFGGFGFYNDGILSLKPLSMKAEVELYPPEVGYQPIIEILKELHTFHRVKSTVLARKLKNRKGKNKESRLGAELSICVILGLAEKDATGSYRISDTGRRLVDPLSSQPEKVEIFKNALLKSPYRDIILNLSKTGKELSYEDMGEAICFALRRDWTELTKKLYGKKFLTWLQAADLVEKLGPNKFKFKTEEIAKKTQEVKEKTKDDMINPSQFFEIGRIIGSLETLYFEEKKEKIFEEKLSILKLILKDYEDLKIVLDLLQQNFALSISSNNPSIYQTNLDFVKRKIKEKLKIGT